MYSLNMTIIICVSVLNVCVMQASPSGVTVRGEGGVASEGRVCWGTKISL